VATVVFAADALTDLELAIEPARGAGAAARAVEVLRSGLAAFASHPLAGRRLDGELRELPVSYGATGCVVVYRFVVPTDEVRVLAVRRQRELDALP